MNSTNKSKIVFSLTTIPERIDSIELTIKSLLFQQKPPSRIHLNIPYVSFRNKKEYVIPQWLQELESVKIVRIDEDYGPASKFIPSLQKLDANIPILVVDDDNIYPPNYIKDFESAEKKNPDVILAASGWKVPNDLIDKPTTLWTNIMRIPPVPLPGTRITQSIKTDIIQGFSGYLLKPRFFDLAEIANYEGVPHKVRFVDDVWVSAKAKVEKFIFPISRFCYVAFFQNSFYKHSSLAKINNWNRQKNEDRNNSIALRFFEHVWKK
ncbi:MAG: glycosyltransferase family 2 protein [Ekhidna sp.]|nr:glycosyltransferase family 2 protein [Ekhidna sp.]